MKNKMTEVTFVAILFSVFGFSLCSDPRDIVTYLKEENFTVVVDDIERTNLSYKLQNEGPFTIFVPTDEAFASLPDAIRGRIHNDLQELRYVVQSHVVNGVLVGPVIESGLAADTLTGRKLHFSKNPDGSVSVNGVKVLGADIVVRNGVLHSIEKVLLPPTQNVMEYLRTNEDHLSDLEASIYLSGLSGKLKSNGPFTIFAPTDKAFSVAKETILPILGDTANLTELIKHHVIPNTLYSTDMSNRQEFETLGNSNLRVSKTFGGGLYINDLRVIRADIEVTNGVLHLLDDIILPSKP